VAAQYRHKGLSINLDAPHNPPPATAAVEVTCYRITQEALTDVVRHAGARSCSVLLALEEEARTVRVEITDDGRGLNSERKGASLGLSSMRERAEELGGTCMPEDLSS
jgi:signal transduction histidine kinase